MIYGRKYTASLFLGPFRSEMFLVQCKLGPYKESVNCRTAVLLLYCYLWVLPSVCNEKRYFTNMQETDLDAFKTV
jgi:hypothetical protein